MSARGALVVLEGGEGVGKTTQWERLAAALRADGTEVLALREPGGTPPGDAIRTILLSTAFTVAPVTEALLFAASRAELLSRTVRPALERGCLVLLDRFLLSTYMYQGVGRGLPIDMLRTLNATATGGLVPDCTLVLQVPMEEALRRRAARGHHDRMEQEAPAFHARVAQGFHDALTPAWQEQHPECGPLVAINATGSEAEVTQRCVDALRTSRVLLRSAVEGQ